MPIYEFYCPDCNTVYNFLSRKSGSKKVPLCPRCKKDSLKKEVTTFATLSGQTEESVQAPQGFDESKLGKAMEFLEKESAGISEDNPKETVCLMRKFSDVMGMKMGSNMEEALSRIEAGEPPEQVEAEMGELFTNEDPFSFTAKGRTSHHRPPVKDDVLYDM
ncbi:MAG: FmdB family zinc ribbon protein [Nitrospinota bacterium]